MDWETYQIPDCDYTFNIDKYVSSSSSTATVDITDTFPEIPDLYGSMWAVSIELSRSFHHNTNFFKLAEFWKERDRILSVVYSSSTTELVRPGQIVKKKARINDEPELSGNALEAIMMLLLGLMW
jgi:hypothetical protein